MKTPLDMKEGETLVKTYNSQTWNWHAATVQICLGLAYIHWPNLQIMAKTNTLPALTAEQVWSGIHPLTWGLHVPGTGIQPLSQGSYHYSISTFSLVHCFNFLLKVSKFWTFLVLGGTLFHIPADLTKKDLLDTSLSTMGTRKVPSSALLVTAAWSLELM